MGDLPESYTDIQGDTKLLVILLYIFGSIYQVSKQQTIAID